MVFTIQDEGRVVEIDRRIADVEAKISNLAREFTNGSITSAVFLERLDTSQVYADHLRAEKEELMHRKDVWQRAAQQLTCCQRSQCEGQIGNTCTYCGKQTD